MRLLFLMILVLSPAAFAQQPKEAFRSTNYPLPRFVSLSAGEAYVRSGPGLKYPVQWVFNRDGLPVEIILEYDHWRKIRDFEGQEGWLHKSLLSGKRTAIVQSDEQAPMFKKPDTTSGLAAYLEPQVVVKIHICGQNWCEIDAFGYTGWIEQENLWGVYPNEEVED